MAAMTIEDNLFTIKTQIQNAHLQHPHGEAEPRLIAVSKTQPIAAIKALRQLGIMDFGENYAQEMADKAQQMRDQLPNTLMCWHFIGPIQSNKTRLIAQHADWIHSVDRLKIAKRLDAHAAEFNKTLNILIQVNISDDPQKSGVSVEALPELINAISPLPHLALRGLMCIPHAEDQTAFTRMHNCFTPLAAQYAGFDTLSMGMSTDFVEAIAQGATMVRVGRALFGARK